MLHGCFDTELEARWKLMTEMCLPSVSWGRSGQAVDRIWVSSNIWKNQYSVQVSANKGSCCLLNHHRQCKTVIRLTHNARTTLHHVRTRQPVRTSTNTMNIRSRRTGKHKTHTQTEKHTKTKRQPTALTLPFCCG